MVPGVVRPEPSTRVLMRAIIAKGQVTVVAKAEYDNGSASGKGRTERLKDKSARPPDFHAGHTSVTNATHEPGMLCVPGQETAYRARCWPPMAPRRLARHAAVAGRMRPRPDRS